MGKREAFSVLFATWPRHDSEPKMDSLVKAFETSCLYCEPVAVERAVRRFVTGNVDGHNMAFRPTPPQVAQLATRIQNQSARAAEIASRAERQTKQLEYQGPSQEERDAGIDRWQKVKASLPELETVKAYRGKRASKSWDNNPQRWHDKAELTASAKRLQAQGYMYDPDKTREENDAIWHEKLDYYRATKK